MSDSRRQFLLRFAATAMVAAGGGCENPENERNDHLLIKRPEHKVVYGPPIRNDMDEAINVPAQFEIRFAAGSAKLDAAAEKVLAEKAAWLRKFANYSVRIEGHCDDLGTREYNIALGDARANAVKNYLLMRGFDVGKIQTVSIGKERPVDMGKSKEAMARNRRAVIIMTPKR